MPELPKFVVERLKVSSPLAGHPDPDVLSSFTERSLPASERAVVLEHLARCRDCREVIALALPVTEAAQAPEARVQFSSRWRWPVLRGVAALAGIILVAAIGIRQFRHRAPASVMVARNAEQKQIVTPPVANKPEIVTPPPQTAASPGAIAREEARSAHPPAQPLSATADGLGSAGKPMNIAAGSAGGVGAGASPAQGTKMAMAAPPRDLGFATAAPAASMKQLPPSRAPGGNPPPASSQMVEVQNQSAVVTGESQAATQLETQTAEPRSQAERADNVTRAKPAATIPSDETGANLPITSRNVLDLQANQPAPTAHWTISSTGTLQRSFDGGRTWQDVNVNAKPGLYAGSMQMAVAANNQESREVPKKLARAKTAAPATSPSPVFRALAVIGSQVWAGASGGVLYHSADGGTLWATLVPSAQGVPLTGDIVRIEFSDALHGIITTSTPETWTTADGGQSWQKQ